METILTQIMDGILNCFQDRSYRVRYAACHAIGLMSTNFTPILQKKFQDKVIPELLMLMDDKGNPRVQTHACAALVNFSDVCPKEILALHLNSIVDTLEAILSAESNGKTNFTFHYVHL